MKTVKATGRIMPVENQGSQYTSLVHENVLKGNEIKISMDGKGRAIDNIFAVHRPAVERLWRSVKYEDIYLQCCEGGKSLRKGLGKYFNFYNDERLHESLNYKMPGEKY